VAKSQTRPVSPCAARISSTGTPMCAGASMIVLTCEPSSSMTRTTPAGIPVRRSSTTKKRLRSSYAPYSAAITPVSLPKADSKTRRSTVRPTSASGSPGLTTMDRKRPGAGRAARAVALIRRISPADRS
jgi:hypothetical protein